MSNTDLALKLTMTYAAQAAMAQFKKDMEQGGAVTKETAAQLALTNKAMKDATAISSQLAGATARNSGVFRTMANDMNNLQGFGLRVSSSLMGIVRAYGPLAGLGGGLALAMGLEKAVSASNDFEISLRNMQALVGVSRDQLMQWKGQMLDIATEFGRAPKEVADAMYFITSSGFQGKEALDVLKASAEGAGAGLGDMRTIADAATSAVSAYGHGNLTAADAVGQMLEAVKVGKSEPAELASAMGLALGVSAQAGVSFHDVAAAVAALSLSGIKAAEGITTVRQTLLAVEAPNRQVQRMFEQLSGSAKGSVKSFADFAAKWKEIQQVFRDQGYLAGINKLIDLSKQFALPASALRIMLHDVQAVNAAFLLTGKNADQVKAIFEDLGKSGAKNLTQAWDIAAQSTATKFAEFKSYMERTFIEIGDAITPALVTGVDNAMHAFDFLRDHVNELKDAVITLGVDGAAALALIYRESLLAFGTTLIGGFGTALELLSGEFIMVDGAALTATGAIVDFGAALAATGFGVVIIAIGAFTEWLLHNADAAEKAKQANGVYADNLKNVASTGDKVVDVTNRLATATGIARDKAMEEVQALVVLEKQHIRTAEAALRQAQAEAGAAAVQLQGAQVTADVNAGQGSAPGVTDFVTAVQKHGADVRNTQAQSNLAAAKKAVADTQSQLAQLQKDLAAPIPTPQVPTPDGTLDPYALGGHKGAKKGHHGPKSEAEQDWEDQTKAIQGWLLAAQKARQEAEALQTVTVTPSMTFWGGTPEQVAQMTAEQDALAEKRQKAQDRAISKGHVLTDQQLQAIQLTKEEKAAIDSKTAAEMALTNIQTQNADHNQNEQGVANAKAEAKFYTDAIAPYQYLAKLDEVRKKNLDEYAKGQRTSAAITQDQIDEVMRLTDADFAATQAMNARKAVFDDSLGKQDFTQRMAIGFNTLNLAQQQNLALWQATYNLRESTGRLDAQLTPAEIQHIKDETAQQYKLNEAAQAFADKKAMLDGMFDSFATFFHDSVFGAKSLKQAIADLIKSLIDLIYQYEILAPLKRSFDSGMGGGGGLGGIFSALLGGGAAAGASSTGSLLAGIGSGLDFGITFAKGGVFSGGRVVPFAGGGIVGSPTMFPMSGGNTGLMGEAGPEAIMPLTRDRQGRLGIHGGGGMNFSPTLVVQVTAPEGTTDPTEFGRLINVAVEAKLQQFVAKERRPGGALDVGMK